MTSPAASTTPYPLTPGAPAVRLTDGAGSTPDGLALVNVGTNGGTVWISTGPALSGASIPLGPGATLQWTDPAAFPYASLSASATKGETLVVTSQASDYSNPTTVAAALIQQGIPTTFLDQSYGTFRVFSGGDTGYINVGQSSTLTISTNSPQPSPQGPGVAVVRFDDAAVPDLPESQQYLTNNNAIEQTQNTWTLPVRAPRLRVSNMQTPDFNNADMYITIIGNNRPSSGLRQIGDGMGQQIISQVLNNTTQEQAILNTTAGPAAGLGYSAGSRQTRANGDCIVRVIAPVPGTAHPYWVDKNGRVIRTDIPANAAGLNDTRWFHPAVPVYWTFQPNTATAGTVYVEIFSAA